MIDRVVATAIFATLISGCAATGVCDQAAGELSLENQEFEQAYEDLKACEHDPDVSSDTLGTLAILIGWAEIGGYPANRPEHIYELLLRAAKLGNQDALLEMETFYARGVEEMRVNQDWDVSRCFGKLAGTATDEDSDFSVPVEYCLSLGD